MLKRASFALFLLSACVVLFSCEKKDDGVIDPTYDSPILSNLVLVPDTVKTTSGSPVIKFYISAVADVNNGTPLTGVTCTVTDPKLNSYGAQNLAYAYDTAGGKKYAATLSLGSVSCLLVGDYTIQVIATNEQGLSSNMLSSSFYVQNTANVAPVVSNPDIPDSVVRPLSGSVNLTLSLTATDADGPCDIAFVYMDAYRPSGNFIGRYAMTYNGNNVYSYTNTVSYAEPDSSYGYYKYWFTALDRSDVFSTTYKDSIKFVRPN
ncbi:MAG TPA: hypothetical protein VN514_02630 [Ignavibacteria bacterium]|nr:hypothetical protein [Ignavibacteria bacterium]